MGGTNPLLRNMGLSSFVQAQFVEQPDFGNRNFNDAFTFRLCIFQKPPKFYGVDIHADIEWAGASFRGFHTGGAYRDYRLLRTKMQELGSHQDVNTFFECEQRALRMIEKPSFRRIMSYLYDMTASYAGSGGFR